MLKNCDPGISFLGFGGYVHIHFSIGKNKKQKKTPALQKFSYEDMSKFCFSLVGREENEPG